MQLEISKPMEN